VEKANPVKTVSDAVWHRKLLIGWIVAVVITAGAVIYTLTPPTYEAQAQVYVDPAADQALQQGEGLLIKDLAQQATSRRVLARAGLQLVGAPTPEQLAPRITAAVVQAPNLSISATAGSPASAAELANAVAVAVVGQHRADSAQRGLQSQTYLSGELARLAAVIRTDQATGASADQQNLDRQAYTNTYTRLQDMQLREARAAESVSVTQQALAPDRPVNPDLVRYVGVAAAAGIFIALLVALLVERFDDRVFDSETVANVSGASLVVVTPSSKRAERGELPAQYTLAYAHIAARYPTARTIMVAASSHRESTDPVAAAFGDAAEMAGDRAIVLQREPSANPIMIDEPRPSRRWPRVGRQGMGWAMLNEAAAGPGTLTLPALAIAPPGPAEAPTPKTFVAVPAPFLSPRAASLSHVVDVAIVVATARSTRMAEVVRTAECLRSVGVEPVAVVLVHKGSAGQARVEISDGRLPGMVDNIIVRPGDISEAVEDRKRLSLASPGTPPEENWTEVDSNEEPADLARSAEVMPAPAAATEAMPPPTTPAETSSIGAAQIKVKKKVEDFAAIAKGVTVRSADAPSIAKVDEEVIATPSAVKNKADSLAGVGPSATVRPKTKAYRINR
jgi:capsular polysaccharide biosynthesis protein